MITSWHRFKMNKIRKFLSSLHKDSGGLSPIAIECCLICAGGVYCLVRVDRYGGPYTLMGTLQGFIVCGEYIHVAGHTSRCKVRQVLAALFLLGDFSLVAVPPGISALCTARGKRTWSLITIIASGIHSSKKHI